MFLGEVKENGWRSTEILLAAFRNYSAAAHQVRAIRRLEEGINPYTLSEFANEFRVDEDPWGDSTQSANEFELTGICDI